MQDTSEEAQERRAIAQLKRGDLDGLATLIRQHQLKAVRTAYLVVGDLQTAQDVATEAFLSVHTSIARFDPKRPFAAWLHRILVNKAISVLRQRKRELPVETEALEAMSDPARSPEAQAVAGIARDTIWRAVQTLPEAERTLVVLRYYLDYSEQDMAETTRQPVGTVKWRLHAARNTLRAALAEAHANATLQLDE